VTASRDGSKSARVSRRAEPLPAESLREYGRGIGGGFLFSLPLLYTMEVWWSGLTVSPSRLLTGIGATFLLLCAYNAYAGLRHDTEITEIAIDSVEELGLGLTVSAIVLLILARPQDGGLMEILGQVVLEGMFVAIGVSVGTAQLGVNDRDQGQPKGRHDSLPAELTLAMCGTVLVAANVAPTDEILQLGVSMGVWQLLGVAALSLLVAATLLYYSNFRGSARFGDRKGPFAVFFGSVTTYAVALAGSAAMLWFFGRFDDTALHVCVAQVVVLGFPATLGAAAGRLLLR
jgi:putative integral membrane protein (TIGR02587 family)